MIFINYILLLAFQIGFITLPLSVIRWELIGGGIAVVVAFSYVAFVACGAALAMKFAWNRVVKSTNRLVVGGCFALLAALIVMAYALLGILNESLFTYVMLIYVTPFLLMPAGAAIALENIRNPIRSRILIGLVASLVVIGYGWILYDTGDNGLNAFDGDERAQAEIVLGLVNSECVRYGFNRLSDIYSEGRHKWRVASVEPLLHSDHQYRVKIQFYSWMRLPTYSIHLPPLDNRTVDDLCSRF